MLLVHHGGTVRTAMLASLNVLRMSCDPVSELVQALCMCTGGSGCNHMRKPCMEAAAVVSGIEEIEGSTSGALYIAVLQGMVPFTQCRRNQQYA